MNQKNILHSINRTVTKIPQLLRKKYKILALAVIVLALPVIVIVSEQEQNTKQYAEGATTINFVDSNGVTISQTNSPTVNVQLNAPWPIAQAASKSSGNVAGTAAYVVYDDALAQKWSSKSTNATINYSNTAPVLSGKYSLSITPTTSAGSLELSAPPNGFLTSSYNYLQFYVYATANNENFGIYLQDKHNNQLSNLIPLNNYGGYPSTTGWTLYTIPLTGLNSMNQTLGGIVIKNNSTIPQSTIYIDQMQFVYLSTPPATPTPTPLPTALPTKIPPATPTPNPTATPTPLPTDTPTPLPTDTPVPPTATPTTTPVNTVSAEISDDPNFGSNTIVINPYNQNPYPTTFTFSDTSDGTKTLYVKFFASDGTTQTYSNTIQLINPTPTPAPSQAAAPTTTPTPSPVVMSQWGVSNSTETNLANADLQTAQSTLDNTFSYITGPWNATTQNKIPAGWSSIPTANYKSYADEQSTPPQTGNGITAGLYDPENWAQTPLNEQQHPSIYMTNFCSAMHAANLTCILTPARDLLMVSGSDCVKQNGETLSQAYIRCNIAGEAAQAGANIVSLQFQTDEATPATYASENSQAIAQVKAVNPNITIWAQLTTAISGTAQSSCTLYNAYESVANSVNGFWLNVGSGGTEPQVGINFLKDVQAHSCAYTP